MDATGNTEEFEAWQLTFHRWPVAYVGESGRLDCGAGGEFFVGAFEVE